MNAVYSSLIHKGIRLPSNGRWPGASDSPMCFPPGTDRSTSSLGLFSRNVDCRAVRQHFRYPLRELGGVVAHADDSIGPHLLGVLHHPLIRLLAGRLADL